MKWPAAALDKCKKKVHREKPELSSAAREFKGMYARVNNDIASVLFALLAEMYRDGAAIVVDETSAFGDNHISCANRRYSPPHHAYSAGGILANVIVEPPRNQKSRNGPEKQKQSARAPSSSIICGGSGAEKRHVAYQNSSIWL